MASTSDFNHVRRQAICERPTLETAQSSVLSNTFYADVYTFIVSLFQHSDPHIFVRSDSFLPRSSTEIL